MEKACPNEERLADYLAGRITDDDRLLVEQHVSECDLCLETIVTANTLRTVVDPGESDPVPNRVTESAVREIGAINNITPVVDGVRFKQAARRIVSRITERLHLHARPPLYPAAVRGSKDTCDPIPVRKIFAGVEFDIEIEISGENRAAIRIRETDVDPQKHNHRVTLLRGRREIYSCVLEDGHVLMEDIPFGRYDLIFLRDGRKIGSDRLEIRDKK